MAKKTAPKIESESVEPVVATHRRKGRTGPVLKVMTATELHDLVGDEPIGVSIKDLKRVVLAKRSADILSEAGF